MLFSAVRHEVSFWHGHDRLNGALLMPEAPGPHPVLVMVRDPHHRERDYSGWLEPLADAGIASFSWDRSRCGSDPGDAARAVPHRAREVLSAVERLRLLPELDARAVAVMGSGEGGWAAAQATTYSHQLAALILACTPVAAPADGGYDPRPTVSGVTVPVLALFGEQDPLVPLEESVRGVRAALRGGDHVDHEVAVVRGADHGLRVRAPHGLGPIVDGMHRFGEWPVGLTRLVAEWLHRRLRPDGVPAFAPPLQPAAVRFPRSPRPRAGHAPPTLPTPVPVRQVRRHVSWA